MVRTSLLLSLVAVQQADATSSCSGTASQATSVPLWTTGGTPATAANTVSPYTAYCGTHSVQTSWGDLLPGTGATTFLVTDTTGCATGADGAHAVVCDATDDRLKCCHNSCSTGTTWMAGAGTSVVSSGATAATVYCGADKVPLPTATQATTILATNHFTTKEASIADIASCCQDACQKTTTVVGFVAGAGTDTTTSFYCGAGKIPIANQATTPSGIATNAGGAAQKTVCCNDSCGKVSFMAGAGTDNSAATTPIYYCGLGSVPVASQASTDSGSDAVGASQKTTCCDNSCGKVSFKAGAGTDVSTSGSEAYYCGLSRVPVASQATVPSGSDAVGSAQKTTCCDDACGKVTFKAGKGTDSTTSTTYYCGENKVPVASQATVPSGSDAIGAAQKGTCCAGACSTMTYKAGEGTDASTTYFCGKNKAPKKDQKTLPCNGATCTSAGKSNCCAATCASTKWAMGKKPTSPATGTMYCGDGMSPKAALADTVCAVDGGCVEATDAGTCCEKTKVNNSSATTDAQTAGASVLLLSAALLMTIQ
jgi:hypothetical protein